MVLFLPCSVHSLLSILSQPLVQGTSSLQICASTFFPILYSKTPVPSPVADCWIPSKMCGAVSRYVCIYGGWIHEPAQSLHPHLSCTYVITMAQSQRIGITEVGSESKVIEWCTLLVCSSCAQHVRNRKWQSRPCSVQAPLVQLVFSFWDLTHSNLIGVAVLFSLSTWWLSDPSVGKSPACNKNLDSV